MARTRFSLATCNLYNLNLPGLKLYRDADGWDAPAFARKAQWLAEAIRRVDALAIKTGALGIEGLLGTPIREE